MWSPRTQNDRMRFAEKWRLMLEQTPKLDFWQDAVVELLIENGTCVGVKTQLGATIRSRSVVVTAGTFLNGLMHVGEKQFGGGRAGEKAVRGITEQLVEHGFSADRMKTGTPPRVDGRSINYGVMEEQKGDNHNFSYTDTPLLKHQRSCHSLPTRVSTCSAKALTGLPCSTDESRLGAPVLPEHRRQNRAVHRQRRAPVVCRARRVGHHRSLCKRIQHKPA